MSLSWPRSFHLLDHPFEIIRHFRQRFESNLHRAVFGFGNECVHFRKFLILVREIFPKLCPATLLSLTRRFRYRFRDCQHAFQIEGSMPPGMEIAASDAAAAT